MAQQPPKDQITKPVEADRTVRLPRKGLGLEKDEPTQALQMGVPAADATLRLKRDDLLLEEPTVSLKAGEPAADSTLRLKRDEMSLEEPTQALERPMLRTALEVIDEATQVKTPQVKPSVMIPDAMDIPSWEETTQFFNPAAGGHADSTIRMLRPLEPPPVPVDPSDSMDETFSNVSVPVLPQAKIPAPMEATSLMLVAEISETEEDTLVLPDMHELDDLPNAMKSTIVMPVMEAPAAPEKPEPMEATIILPISAEEPSAYLTRQGQSPWPSSTESSEASPVSTQLMSESLLSKAMEATSKNADSALAPVPPEVTAMEDDSPLAKTADIPAASHPIDPSSPTPGRNVDTSIGMVVTPPTLLMPVQPPLDATVPVKRPTPPPVSPPSVPGYPDRKVPAPLPEPKFQTKPIASPIKLVIPAPIPMAPQAIPAESSSKMWIPVAIGILLLIIGGIYFAFFRTSLKMNLPLVTLPNQATEPSLSVPADMQGTLAQAKGGDSKAMHMLGVSFYYGLNVPQNKAEGLRWMRKAAGAGNEKAKSDLRQMESGGR